MTDIQQLGIHTIGHLFILRTRSPSPKLYTLVKNIRTIANLEKQLSFKQNKVVMKKNNMKIHLNCRI